MNIVHDLKLKIVKGESLQSCVLLFNLELFLGHVLHGRQVFPELAEVDVAAVLKLRAVVDDVGERAELDSIFESFSAVIYGQIFKAQM
jgi:hypothetical protein